MSDIDLTTCLETYLQMLDARNLDACVAAYTDDAVIHFAMGVYTGKDSITEWHRDRFEAELRVLSHERMVVKAQQVRIEMMITSKRIKAWRINTLRTKGVFSFVGAKIKEVRFSMVGANPLEGWQ